MLLSLEGGIKPLVKGESQQQTRPTYRTGPESATRAALAGDERSCHCAISAPLKIEKGAYSAGRGIIVVLWDHPCSPWERVER